MEYAKSVRHALRPRSLFGSLVPVGISLSLLRISHDISLLRADVLAALVFAALVQLLANLNGVYGAFRRSLRPQSGPSDGHGHSHGDGHSHGPAQPPKIVINLLSQTQVQRWSYALFALLVATALAAHVAQHKSAHATGGALAVAALALAYCRRQSGAALPAVKGKSAAASALARLWSVPGLEEAVVAAAAGPLAILGTHLYVVDYPLDTPASQLLPWPAAVYSLAVWLFMWAFQVAQSAKDAPFAQMMAGPAAGASLALRLGHQRTFQAFLLLLVASYALVCLVPLTMGHLPNLLLIVTLERVKDISDDFREDQLYDLPDRVAALGGFLGAALIVSINVSAVLILGK